AQKPRLLAKIEGPGRVESVAMSADGKTLSAASSYGGLLLQWDLSGPQPKARDYSAGPRHAVTSVAWSQDGRQIVAGGTYEQSAWVWDWDWDGKRFQSGLSWPVTKEFRAIALSP